MGVVWKAQDEVLPRLVAVKVVGGARRADPVAVKRFRREAIAMANVAHPNVASVYDVGQQDDQWFLVMELLTGPSVARMVAEQGMLPIAQTVRMGSQVARGLSAAHAIGITHRDIKPGNVVLHGQVAKIVDFGIARLEAQSAQALTSPAMAIGTAAYMSPEQARGKLVQPSSDIYSLACLLTTMLTGKPPFVDPDPIEVARAHAVDVAQPIAARRPEIPSDLNDLVAAMLVKRPSDRPTATQVAAALSRVESQLLGLVEPGSPNSELLAPAPASPVPPRTPRAPGPDSQPTPVLPPDPGPERRRFWPWSR